MRRSAREDEGHEGDYLRMDDVDTPDRLRNAALDTNLKPGSGHKKSMHSKYLVSAKFSLSHAAISAPQLLDFEALLGSV
jgi:hypothetical protein